MGQQQYHGERMPYSRELAKQRRRQMTAAFTRAAKKGYIRNPDLARLTGVNPNTIGGWRRGIAPTNPHFTVFLEAIKDAPVQRGFEPRRSNPTGPPRRKPNGNSRTREFAKAVSPTNTLSFPAAVAAAINTLDFAELAAVRTFVDDKIVEEITK